MNFSEILNNYLNILNCSAQDLANSSNLSPTLVSRYLNNKRTPRQKSEYLNKLVDGIYNLSIKNNLNLNKEEILEELNRSIIVESIDFDDFVDNFNCLIVELKINISDIANYVGYDTSFISKVRNKKRKPSDLNDFSQKIVDFIEEKYNTNESIEIISSITNCTSKDLNKNFKAVLYKWLVSHQENHSEIIKTFLQRLDTFDLNDYTGIDFKKVKVPTSPIILKNSKVFFGTEGRKKAEADFLKTTLLSKSKEPIFFYSNLPIAKAAQDETFKNKWMLAITMVLKKGLHLNMIHDIDRPLNEMLLGLESWIPIYMTGSISPYYFKEPPSNMFYESLYLSGSICVSGNCLKNNDENSRFYLTTKTDELNFYKEKANNMLSHAKPLMTIFKEKDKSKFDEFLKKEKKSNFKKIENVSFKNIDFFICKNKWISINKKTSPEMHFVIYNQKLRGAIEAFLTK